MANITITCDSNNEKQIEAGIETLQRALKKFRTLDEIYDQRITFQELRTFQVENAFPNGSAIRAHNSALNAVSEYFKKMNKCEDMAYKSGAYLGTLASMTGEKNNIRFSFKGMKTNFMPNCGAKTKEFTEAFVASKRAQMANEIWMPPELRTKAAT